MAQASSGRRFTRLMIAMIFTIGLLAPGQVAVAGCAFVDLFCSEGNGNGNPDNESGGRGANTDSATEIVKPDESTGNSSVKSVAQTGKPASKKKKASRSKAKQGKASKGKN